MTKAFSMGPMRAEIERKLMPQENSRVMVIGDKVTCEKQIHTLLSNSLMQIQYLTMKEKARQFYY